MSNTAREMSDFQLKQLFSIELQSKIIMSNQSL